MTFLRNGGSCSDAQALNALIRRALQNNPNLQSALATLRAAKESVYAQEGKLFPLSSSQFQSDAPAPAAVVLYRSFQPLPASSIS